MKQCPKCGTNLVDIVYGEPSFEIFERADRKEVKLGGCEISPDNLSYHCYNCNLDFSKDLKKSVKSDDNWWQEEMNEKVSR
ncbi:hypothetical protein IJI55_02190 [Candidatus Saccharibacteria bacterium]|nr:hypothetical protein [Candidatus Saccharibacteria bacterium]